MSKNKTNNNKNFINQDFLYINIKLRTVFTEKFSRSLVPWSTYVFNLFFKLNASIKFPAC